MSADQALNELAQTLLKRQERLAAIRNDGPSRLEDAERLGEMRGLLNAIREITILQVALRAQVAVPQVTG